MSSRKTPVSIIGGYLGSGKTTLVNHLLRHCGDIKVAVLVNDFGDLPIDADLIESEVGNIISLSGGCVCCSYGNDLSMALMNVLELETQPEHIVIEASGVALPGAIASSITLIQNLQLLGTIVLVNAESIQSLSTDRYVGDTIERQISHADLLVLNKMDLLDKETCANTSAWIKGKWPAVRLICASHAVVPVSLVLDIMPMVQTPTPTPTPTPTKSNVESKSANRTIEQKALQHDSALFTTFSLAVNDKLDVSKLAQTLACNDFSLSRAKGFATDRQGMCKLVQVVGRRWDVIDAPPSLDASMVGKIVCIGIAEAINVEKIRQTINRIV